MANTPFVKARGLWCPAIDASRVWFTSNGSGEGRYSRADNLVKGRVRRSRGTYARFIKKTIVKPCAGKLQARFERGLMETDQQP